MSSGVKSPGFKARGGRENTSCIGPKYTALKNTSPRFRKRNDAKLHCRPQEFTHAARACSAPDGRTSPNGRDSAGSTSDRSDTRASRAGRRRRLHHLHADGAVSEKRELDATRKHGEIGLNNNRKRATQFALFSRICFLEWFCIFGPF